MSSYIRLEILLFFRAFETGVGMLVVYRLTDMLKRRLFCDRMWNSTVDILYWLLVQIAIQNGHLCHVRRSVCDIIGGQPKTN